MLRRFEIFSGLYAVQVTHVGFLYLLKMDVHFEEAVLIPCSSAV